MYLADVRLPIERANGIQTVQTAHALARRGHTVMLVCRPDTERPAREPLRYYGLPPLPSLTLAPVRVLGPSWLRRAQYLMAAAAWAMGRTSADILMTRDLGVASLLLRIPRACRPPLVYESHGFAPVVAGEMARLLSTGREASPRKRQRLFGRERHVWHVADGYVTITSGLLRELKETFGSRSGAAVVPDGASLPAHVLGFDACASSPPGSDPDGRTPVTAPHGSGVGGGTEGPRAPRSAAAGAGTSQDSPLVGYAGHLYPWKGVDVLVDALARLPLMRGLIVGGHPNEGDLARLRDRARTLGAADRIEFTGQVPPAEVRTRLAAADVLVLPNRRSQISSHYTSPLKLFEYLALGKPIVASDLPALREILTPGVTAELVEPDDAAALAEALSRVVGAPAYAAALGEHARQLAAEFSWDKRAERLEAIFTSLPTVQA